MSMEETPLDDADIRQLANNWRNETESWNSPKMKELRKQVNVARAAVREAKRKVADSITLPEVSQLLRIVDTDMVIAITPSRESETRDINFRHSLKIETRPLPDNGSEPAA